MENKATILIVDDDLMLLSLLTDTLHSVGYDTRSASEGVSAMEVIREEDIDIVIADISMPGMDGIELLQKIKDVHPRLPVILMTGVSMNGIRSRALQAGADGFLDKPFRLSAIEDMMVRLVNKRTSQASNILILDDNNEHMDSLGLILEGIGYSVTKTLDVAEAFRIISSDQIDTVITDLKMPVMSGVDVARRVKEEHPAVQVIIYSGYAPDDAEATAIRSAADHFMTKPVNLELMNTILAQV